MDSGELRDEHGRLIGTVDLEEVQRKLGTIPPDQRIDPTIPRPNLAIYPNPPVPLGTILENATLGQIVDEMERRGFSLHITFSKTPPETPP